MIRQLGANNLARDAQFHDRLCDNRLDCRGACAIDAHGHTVDVLIQSHPYDAWDAHYRILKLIAPIRKLEEGKLTLMDDDFAACAHLALGMRVVTLPFSQNAREAHPSQTRLREVC
jgi:hypothetical protein